MHDEKHVHAKACSCEAEQMEELQSAVFLCFTAEMALKNSFKKGGGLMFVQLQAKYIKPE